MDQLKASKESAFWWALVALVIAIATFTRFFGLSDRGIVLWDTAHYLEKSIQLMQELDHAIFRGAGLPLLSWCELKPGHLLANAVSFSIFGVSDVAILGVQALCGVLTVLVVYLIGREIDGPRTGIIAAALFSIAGLAVGMSRTGWPQAISGLILGLGYLFYQSSLAKSQKQWRFIILTGITGGMAATTHLLFLVFYFAIPLAEILRVAVFHELSIRQCFMRVSLLVIAMAATVALFEIALNQLGSGFLGCTFGYVLEKQSFVGQIKPNDLVLTLRNFLNFDYVIAAGKFFWITLKEVETIFFGIAVLVSLVLLSYFAFRLRSPVLFSATLHLLVGLFFALFVYATIKALYHLYIPICIAGGMFYSRMLGLADRSRVRIGARTGTTIFVAVLLVCGFLASWPLIMYRSGYDAAVKKIIELTDTTQARFSLNEQHLSHSLSTVVPYYIYRKNGERLRFVDSKRIGNFQTTDLFIVDFRAFKKGVSSTQISEAMIKLTPVFQVSNMARPLPTVHFHRIGDLKKLIQEDDSPESRDLRHFVSVYDLRGSNISSP